MKTVIIRCEDRGRVGEQTTALLAGAKTVHLQQLAQAGAVGVIRRASPGVPIRRRALHGSLLGLPGISSAQCYLASAGLSLGERDTAWCCDLLTQRDGVIVDVSGGRISTSESRLLIRALNERAGSPQLRWHVGEGAHHLVIAQEASLEADESAAIEAPELLAGRPWRSGLPQGANGDALAVLIEQSSAVLDGHEVNRVRVDLGENPANLLWFWGATKGEASRRIARDGTSSSAAIISGSFFLKGLAACAGFRWVGGPESLDEAGVQSVISELPFLIEQHDLVYAHLDVTSDDPVERQCAMERLDQLVLKPLTERLPSFGPWRLLVAIDDVTSGTVPFMAIGTGLAQHPVPQFTAERAAASPLVFEDGAPLSEWLLTSGPT